MSGKMETIVTTFTLDTVQMEEKIAECTKKVEALMSLVKELEGMGIKLTAKID
jgi:hypothetical protein